MKATLIVNERQESLAPTWKAQFPSCGCIEVTQVMTATEVQLDPRAIHNPIVVYSPQSAVVNFKDVAFPLMPAHPFVMPWFPRVSFPSETAIEATAEIHGWIASTDLLQQALPQLGSPPRWTLLNLAEILERSQIPFHWGTVSGASTHLTTLTLPDLPSVLAVVPHYRCERWLSRCLRSLVSQTHPPTGIVVIDDGSNHPPVEMVAQFPTVTLLAASERVGPYRLIQQVIDDTGYWGYLFQDADDWSSSDRLQHLLHMALTTHAELVGTQEVRVHELDARLTQVSYPLNVNQALAHKPGHPLLHPTSLVTRALVQRVGGFASGLGFGGDTEFLLRAVWVAKVVNLASYSYFRRKRPDSLTTHPTTGLGSPARRALLHQLKQQAIARQQAALSGKVIDLTPLATAPPVALTHQVGPPLIPPDLTPYLT